MSSSDRINAFWAAYLAALSHDVDNNPYSYALRPGETSASYSIRTADKMRAAVEQSKDFGRVNYQSSKAFKAAAKAIGIIPFTRAGLNSIYA